MIVEYKIDYNSEDMLVALAISKLGIRKRLESSVQDSRQGLFEEGW